MQEVIIMPTNTISERLEFVRESRRMTKAGFSRSIGMSPQGYQGMVNDGYITDIVSIAIEYVHGFSREWLKTGEGGTKVEQWENIRGEVEEELLRDVREFMNVRTKLLKPLMSGKDTSGKYDRFK